ncbi:MAG: hypothetical protein DRJ10_12850 [Bacteroidetes bacterium]|nr:MAG: hypothetical protein DRJ10_12850 [Bacteroidota bacterium]RLD82091.1 MAG: hypothetical protein DRJ07_08555 [Bacteroidota bacterium]
MSKELILYPKAKHALNAALAGIVVMTAILFASAKWIMISGIIVSFLLSVFAIFNGLLSMKLINAQKDTFRGNNMAWIAFILGVLIFLSTLPFIIQFWGTLRN